VALGASLVYHGCAKSWLNLQSLYVLRFAQQTPSRRHEIQSKGRGGSVLAEVHEAFQPLPLPMICASVGAHGTAKIAAAATAHWLVPWRGPLDHNMM
jgi:hypothetical protein